MFSLKKKLHFRSYYHQPQGAMMESRAIAKAPEGEGCPRCGGFVYMAEQMLAKGRVSVTFPPPLADHCTQITTSIRSM